MSATYLKLFVDCLEKYQKLNDTEFGRLVRSALRYKATGEEPVDLGRESLLWDGMRLDIDRDNERYSDVVNARSEAGKKGAKVRWQTDSKNSKSHLLCGKNGQEKEEDKDNDNDKDKDNDNDKLKEKSNKKEIRHKYGQYENVLLSDSELEKLKSEFSDYQQRIERLSEYMASTGKSYKNHLATIRAWSRRDVGKQDDSKKSNKSYDIDFLDQYWDKVPTL